jgi:GT2 family glycosyltransferase
VPEAPQPQLAIVLVHYRTPELLAPGLHALALALRHAGLHAELVVVDNGGLEQPDAALRAALARHSARVLATGDNLGYAAGLHAGLAVTRAPWILALNPDVCPRADCLSALWAVARAGADVCAPRLEWDESGRLWLPPTERRDWASALLARLAARGPRWQHHARRRWRRHAQRHWSATHPLATVALSGAALLFTRALWERTGGFDRGYRLYFEETDWLLRAARVGARVCLVPAARARHIYAQSARREPRADQWFAESAARFERRHHGHIARALLRLATPTRAWSPTLPAALPDLSGPLTLPATTRWVEVSPGLLGFPAAGERITSGEAREWRLPTEVWEHLASGLYRVTSVDAHDRELESVTLRHSPQGHPGSDPGTRRGLSEGRR